MSPAKRALAWIAIAVSAVLLAPARAWAEGRRVAVIIDTSGSMTRNDPAKYTVQLTQIISDLLDDRDALTVVKLATAQRSCVEARNPSLAISLSPADRAGFKSRLKSLIGKYDGENYFAAPVRTAIDALGLDPAHPRLLLFIADAGGFEECDPPITKELSALKASGAMVGVVNIDRTLGGFEKNPAFTYKRSAQNSEELVRAVAEVYQQFLGSKKVQTGPVRGAVEIEIDKHVGEAFVVVAAEGPFQKITPHPGNPAAERIEIDLNGGGETRGLDGTVRGYHIVRLRRPAAGRWRFTAEGLGASAGYMVLQEYALAARLVSSPSLPLGQSGRVELQVVDTNTGTPITDPHDLAAMDLSIEVEGRKTKLRDDGAGGDRVAGDGILTADVTLTREGKTSAPVRLQSAGVDQTTRVELEGVRAEWVMGPIPPLTVEVGTPVTITVRLDTTGPGSAPAIAPERLEIAGAEVLIVLRDDGASPDARAGDRMYTATWTPSVIGPRDLTFTAVGGGRVVAGKAHADVIGKLDLGAAVPIAIGPLSSGSTGEGALDLSLATVKGRFEISASSSFASRGAALEIDPGTGFTLLGQRPVTLTLDGGGRRFPLRVRVGRCPAECRPDAVRAIELSAVGPDGQPRRLQVRLTVTVISDPWLRCWWPLLAALAGLAVLCFVIHGFWSPSRFGPRVGVVLSPEEDMGEGFFHAFRAQPGSRSGFYRDAAVYISSDFRISGKPRAAIVRLRADRSRVMIRPLPGLTIWRRGADDDWEELPVEETVARPGTQYRNDGRSLYFEVRNG